MSTARRIARFVGEAIGRRIGARIYTPPPDRPEDKAKP